LPNNRISAYDAKVHELAAEYERQGFDVLVAPSPQDLPDALKPFRPDFIARTNDSLVIVELKYPTKVRRADYWSNLTDAVSQHANWRLELIVTGNKESPLGTDLDRNAIKLRLNDGIRLHQQGFSQPAMLVIWAAAEAAMRYVCQANKIELRNFTPNTLIAALYSNGLVSRDDYDFLMWCSNVRNRISHGFEVENPDWASVSRLKDLTLSLLEEAELEESDIVRQGQ
jgi:hypothetical protein